VGFLGAGTLGIGAVAAFAVGVRAAVGAFGRAWRRRLRARRDFFAIQKSS